jgi:hypothetical protein
MGATPCFDSDNALTVRTSDLYSPWKDDAWLFLRGQGIVLGQKLAVFPGEDIVCYCSYRESRSEVFAEG